MKSRDNITLTEIQHHLEVVRIILADLKKSIPAIPHKDALEMLGKRSELAWALVVQLRGTDPCGPGE